MPKTGFPPADLYARACAAGQAAAAAHDATLPPEAKRGFDVGMAWVVVRPARGSFIAWCRTNGKGSKCVDGGWQFAASAFNATSSQSMDVGYAGARAFAAVLCAQGLAAQPKRRFD